MFSFFFFSVSLIPVGLRYLCKQRLLDRSLLQGIYSVYLSAVLTVYLVGSRQFSGGTRMIEAPS